MLVYDKEGMEEVSGSQTCKFFMSTVVEYLKLEYYHFENLDLGNNPTISLHERLGKAMGIRFASKSCLYYNKNLIVAF